MTDTIYAWSSGRPPSAVGVLRLSGPAVRFALETMVGRVPEPRVATYAAIRDGQGVLVDRGLVLFFPGPRSFTGEDSAEFQVHGSRAVLAALLATLRGIAGLRPADAGEFTRRAFENGRLDLTAVEGLADLVDAETDAQRRQALALAEGGLSVKAEDWRLRIVSARAAVEADLDFADEEDVPGTIADRALSEAAAVLADVDRVLADVGRGLRIRDGFVVALLGPPNAGKSSLLNALARRDVAIVTDVPGTTRDPLEVHLDLGGAPVVLVDTAGLREASDVVEREGVRRALDRARGADLVLWLDEEGRPPAAETLDVDRPPIVIRSKADRFDSDPNRSMADGFPEAISVSTGEGLDRLIAELSRRASAAGGEPSLVTRARQRDCLLQVRRALEEACGPVPPEVRADRLREAGDALGRLVGRIDVEEVLGSIFSSFCIGK